MSVLGLVLLMLLAAAVDFGRAYYTAVVVSNMAAEGASYAALNPSLEYRTGTCTYLTVSDNISIQERARLVGRQRGLVLDAQDQQATTITVTPSDCRLRCEGTTVTVQVNYPLNDLFLPGILGIRDIPIRRSASQVIMRDPDRGHACQGN